MKPRTSLWKPAVVLLATAIAGLGVGLTATLASEEDFSPKPDQRQLPLAMHSAMQELPRITVGRENADLVGTDNRVLQAAVDYIAGLGGGVHRFRGGIGRSGSGLDLRRGVDQGLFRQPRQVRGAAL